MQNEECRMQNCEASLSLHWFWASPIIFYFFYLYSPLAAFSSLDLPLLVKVPEGGLEGFPPPFPPGLFGRF
jgi:hypothetical protein